VFTVTDTITDDIIEVEDREDITARIAGWFLDAPQDVTDALEQLHEALLQHDPTQWQESYLAISITQS